MNIKHLGLSLAITMAGTSSGWSEEFVTLGTGGVTGVYYAVGGAMCRLVNKNSEEHGFRCTVESTGGSVYNVNTIRAGELSVAIAQSDVQYQAYTGTGKYEGDGWDGIRGVFALHPESMTIIARKDARIDGIRDLVGKRVNIGNPGSGTEAVWSAMWKALGYTNDDLELAAQMKSAETPAALCDNVVDAIAWVAGHPLAGALEASSNCDVEIIPIDDPAIDEMVESKPYYARTTIPGGLYEGTPKDVPAFGVGAIFVTSEDVPDAMIKTFISGVFENFEDFKSLHPALSGLTKEVMVENAQSSPLHPAAIEYFSEAGLLDQ